MTSKSFFEVPPLLRALRSAQGPTSTVAPKCFRLCAEEAETIDGLCAATSSPMAETSVVQAGIDVAADQFVTSV